MSTTKTFSGIEIKSAAAGTVRAVFATFATIDHDGDVILPGALTNGAEVVISAYGHQSHVGALPVGKGRVVTTTTEAILDGEFFLDTTAGRDTFTTVKNLGPLGEWSFSLHDVVSERGTWKGEPANLLKSIRVKEVSPVLMGAGINTRTLAAKSRHTDEIRSQHPEVYAAWLAWKSAAVARRYAT